MKIELRTAVALTVGLVLYLAFGPALDMFRGLVDCLVFFDLLSRSINNDKR